MKGFEDNGIHAPASAIHRKGRKERKAMQQESLCSPWLKASSAPAPERAPPVPAVHLRSSRAGG